MESGMSQVYLGGGDGTRHRFQRPARLLCPCRIQ